MIRGIKLAYGKAYDKSRVGRTTQVTAIQNLKEEKPGKVLYERLNESTG